MPEWLLIIIGSFCIGLFTSVIVSWWLIKHCRALGDTVQALRHTQELDDPAWVAWAVPPPSRPDECIPDSLALTDVAWEEEVQAFLEDVHRHQRGRTDV